MAGYVLHLSEQENITLSAAVTRRLIDGGDGDAALLYLCLLKNRGSASPETLRAELKWDEARRSRAEAALARMALVSAPKPEEPTPSPVPAPTAERPAYSREDVARKLEQAASSSALLREVERKLGPLSTPSVGKLLGLYEDLGLPADVLFLLVNHCIARHAAQYGAGRLPTMRRIEQEGYVWARKGLLSSTSANDYLNALHAREQKPTWQSFSSANASPPRARRNTSPPGWTWASPPRPSPSRMIRPSCAATNSSGRTATAS